jgi:3-carboxy-cis,cis-muconate cycloisomerase
MALFVSGFLVPAFSDPETTRRLTDEAHFRALLEVETALARAQAAVGVIPRAAALQIEAAAARVPFQREKLEQGVEHDGTPILALVELLRAEAEGGAGYVHWGATSQDIVDTATVLQVRHVLERFEALLHELMGLWIDLADRHRASIMAARTHGQQAVPTCFGLKVALWLSPLVRHQARLDGLRARVLRAQFGGAAGTLAALGSRALEVSAAFAREVGLKEPDVPWHTQRDGFAELGAWVSSLTGCLGKVAQDVILLSQSEIGEVAEASPGQRGGSSSMPQKNNPLRSEQVLAAARQNASLLSSLHHAMVQEHERATHGWQLEWLTLSPMLHLAGGALRNAVLLTRGLQVYPEKMRENLERNHGLVLAEAAVGELAKRFARPEAQRRVRQAAVRASVERRSLLEVLQEGLAADARAQAAASTAGVPTSELPDPSPLPADLSEVLRPEAYLGQANAFIDRVLVGARQFVVER